MELFRPTLYNGITLLILAATLAAAIHRLVGKLHSNLPLLYYALVLGYTFGFKYSLNQWFVLGALACALLLRFEFLPRWLEVEVRLTEIVFFLYVIWRGLGQILLW